MKVYICATKRASIPLAPCMYVCTQKYSKNHVPLTSYLRYILKHNTTVNTSNVLSQRVIIQFFNINIFTFFDVTKHQDVASATQNLLHKHHQKKIMIKSFIFYISLENKYKANRSNLWRESDSWYLPIFQTFNGRQLWKIMIKYGRVPCLATLQMSMAGSAGEAEASNFPCNQTWF